MTARYKRIADPDELDALKTWFRQWRGINVGYHGCGPGVRRYWKNQSNRRERRAAMRDVREETD